MILVFIFLVLDLLLLIPSLVLVDWGLQRHPSDRLAAETPFWGLLRDLESKPMFPRWNRSETGGKRVG